MKALLKINLHKDWMPVLTGSAGLLFGYLMASLSKESLVWSICIALIVAFDDLMRSREASYYLFDGGFVMLNYLVSLRSLLKLPFFYTGAAFVKRKWIRPIEWCLSRSIAEHRGELYNWVLRLEPKSYSKKRWGQGRQPNHALKFIAGDHVQQVTEEPVCYTKL